MKAALNGALNCSILDGWWDECFDPAHGGNGWAIESAEDDPDQDRRDLREAASLFGILENQVVPRFYDRGRDGVPAAVGRDGAAGVGDARSRGHRGADGAATTRRDLYEPAAASSIKLSTAGGKAAVELAAWRERVEAAWDGVSITSVEVDERVTAGRRPP